jgi:hypothetical protein
MISAGKFLFDTLGYGTVDVVTAGPDRGTYRSVEVVRLAVVFFSEDGNGFEAYLCECSFPPCVD